MQHVRVTIVADRFDETVAAYERLGFERLLKGTPRGALFRAGPAEVEVVDGSERRPVVRPHAVAGRSAPRSRT